MATEATPRTALITGICVGIAGYFLGPYIDDRSKGLVGNLLLIFGAFLVGGSAYVFVFGLSRDQLQGFWLANPALLKRMGAWLLGVASTGAAASFLHMAIERGQ